MIVKFSEYLTKEVGVAVIPISPFYEKGSKEKIIRVCFAKSEEVLKSSAELLNKI
jgi:methionine transaminase